MGKLTASAADDADLEAGGAHGANCCTCVEGVGRGFVSLRCAAVILLSFCVVLCAALFVLPNFVNKSRSGFLTTDSDALSADIKASFVLEKPLSLLVSNIDRLEYEILFEIGLPSTEVSIISMSPLASTNSTSVKFAILPNPKNASISLPALSVLKSSLVELTLQQINLTFTPSFFGIPITFEVLKFPGGITVIPQQSASIFETMQTLFEFTVNNSIAQILKDLVEFDNQLKYGLDLRPFENVYVQLTNKNGSTVSSPVIVQASVFSEFGSRSLEPDRLKQLAHVIKNSQAENLGLNHSVFGKVKGVVLSSYLQHSIESPSPSPSPSPYSAPLPYPVPSVQPPCVNCDAFTPSNSPKASPGPSMHKLAPSPRNSPCITPALPPSASNFYSQSPSSKSYAPKSSVPTYHISPAPASRVAPVIGGPSPQQSKGRDENPALSPLLSPEIPPSLTSRGTIFYADKWLNALLVGSVVLHLLLFYYRY